MPSIRSRPEGPKYGKKICFGYSGRHQVHMNFQPSPPPPSPPVTTPAKVSKAPMAKLYATLNFFGIIICIILFKKNF
jgi:hypothetical protein